MRDGFGFSLCSPNLDVLCHSHFISCSCYQRKPFLGSARRRDPLLTILEQVRKRYDFVVWGYVVMPEHFHLLVTEPRSGSMALAMQVLKQCISLTCRSKEMATWREERPGDYVA